MALTKVTGSVLGDVTADIDYTNSATDAVERTLQSKLEETVSVKDFGAVGDGLTDDTAAIQDAINYLRDKATWGFKSTGAGRVIVPAGIYAVTRITRKSGVSIIGDGSRSTYFVALAETDTVPYGMFENEGGAVVGSHLQGFTALGGATAASSTPVNANQWGLYSHAQWDDTYTDGGEWFSNHEDLEFRHFNYGIWSRGGYTNAHSQRPQQFITFNNVRSFVRPAGEALRLTGQHGQINFTNGDYSGFHGGLSDLNVFIGFDPDPSTTADNSSGHSESTSDTSGAGNAIRTPANVSFNGGLAIQRSNAGIYAEACNNISVDNVWFESIGGAIELGSSGAIVVSNSRFANAGDGDRLVPASTDNGFLVKQGSTSKLEWGAGNFITGIADNWLDPSTNLTNIGTSTFHRSIVSSKDKIAITNPNVVTVGSSGDINTKGHDFAFLAANTTRSVLLATIDSYLTPSEELVLYAYAGAVTITSTDNIRLMANVTELTIGKGTYVTLKRIHKYSGKEWLVTSYMNESQSSAPSDAYYYSKNTIIENTGVEAGGSPGWIVTTEGLAGSTAVFQALANVTT